MANVLQEIRNRISFSSRDWSQEKEDAWLYAVIIGWDPNEDEPEEESAMPEIAARFNLTDEQVAAVRVLHEQFAQLLHELEDKENNILPQNVGEELNHG